MIALLLAIALAVHPSVPNRTESGVPVKGVASWYNATFTPKHGNGGQSTWYTRAGYKFYAAIGAYRFGDHPFSLRVCRADDTSRCVIVSVLDHCARCKADLKRRWTKRSRAIDLSPDAFAVLRGLHLGVVRVIIEEIQPGT